MAINTLAINIFAEKVVNRADSSLKMAWWKTNFNMPTPDIYSNVSDVLRYVGPFTYTNGVGTTSYNLTGFSPGFEIVGMTSIWDWENTGGSTVTVSTNLYNKFKDTDNSTVLFQGYNGANVSFDLGAGAWAEQFYTITTGTDVDEVDAAGTYYYSTSGTGTHPITETNTGITFSNVPDVSGLTLDASTRGAMWVEGNNLCFVNAGADSGGGWKHTIVGTDISSTPGTSAKGALWIDTSNVLHWVGDNGHDYTPTWKVRQFASAFSNSATEEVNAGTSKAGFIWVDNEFGQTHLSYIGYDGYKYLTGAGNNPYA